MVPELHNMYRQYNWRVVPLLVCMCVVAEKEDAALKTQAQEDEKEIEIDKSALRGIELDCSTWPGGLDY